MSFQYQLVQHKEPSGFNSNKQYLIVYHNMLLHKGSRNSDVKGICDVVKRFRITLYVTLFYIVALVFQLRSYWFEVRN